MRRCRPAARPSPVAHVAHGSPVTVRSLPLQDAASLDERCALCVTDGPRSAGNIRNDLEAVRSNLGAYGEVASRAANATVWRTPRHHPLPCRSTASSRSSTSTC